jgi:hypothetical protein
VSALVKLLGSRTGQQLRIEASPGVTTRPTASNLGVVFSLDVPNGVFIVGGEKDGEQLETSIVKASQKVCLRLGSIKPTRYHGVVESNPALAAWGVVQHARLVEPGELQALDIFFRADRQTDLASILSASGGWVVRTYLLD